MDSKDPILSIVMLPWLAHGHASPFLELAKRLSPYNIRVYLCSTPITLCTIKEHLDEKNFPSIQLVEFPLPSLPRLPPHLHMTKYLPHNLMPTLKEAFDLAEPSLEQLLKDLMPNLLVYDFIQPWAPMVARRYGIPAIQFLTTGAASIAFFCHYLLKPMEGFPFSAMSLGSQQEDLKYMQMFDRVANGISDGERLSQCLERSSSFIAIKSFREIEFKYIEYLSRLLGKEIISAGPLIQDINVKKDNECDRFIEWLDQKARSSVLFVSFGSEYFMSQEEMEETAHGLKLSEVAFVWVVRFPREVEGMDMDRSCLWARAMPHGLLERMSEKDKGLIVDGWVPQQAILAHPSIGGFLTHCGWSSVMEGMRFGVPMIALPLQLDQPFNAKLIVELGIGVEVKREEGVIGSFKGEQVAKEIRNMLVEEGGEKVRKKASEMSKIVGAKEDQEIGILVENMIALCESA